MKRILLVFISLLIFTSGTQAQKEKYQSIFIYNFTKYIKWPETYSAEKFIIGVFGDTQMKGELESMVALKKKSGSGVTMEVQQYSSMEEIDDCHVLFVAEEAVDNLISIDSSTVSKPMLIITDSPGKATEGSVINFVMEDGKVKFELNASKAANRGLVISGMLTKLAIVI